MVFICHLLIKALNIEFINLRKNFQIIGSAHNIKEIKEKEAQGVKDYFYCIFIQKKENLVRNK